MKRLRNQKGIALLLVMASLLMWSMMVTNFWNEAVTGHEMALNFKSRVQGYYLAKSALNFSRVLLFYNKKVEDELKKAKVTASELGFQPLYKQFPIDTALIRGLAPMGEADEASTAGGDGLSEDEQGGGPASSDDPMAQAQMGMGMLDQSVVKDFLGFDGDFSVNIEEEQAKFSINGFAKMTANSPGYDLQKRILNGFLQARTFENFFKNQKQDAEDLVHNIADFVDANGVVNGFDGVERGDEDQLYRDQGYTAKNAPLISMSELRLVSGMTDDILEQLKPLVSVYHVSEKVNVCLGEPLVMDALIKHYTRFGECTNPLDDEDQEEVARLRDEALKACPNKSEVARTLNIGLGLLSAVESDVSTADQQSTASQVKECKIQFENLISDENKIFRVEGLGEVRGVRTKITMILDVSGAQAKSWKTLYYQVE